VAFILALVLVFMVTIQTAQDLQDEIFQKMSAEKKIKIAGQLFLFGKKLESLRNQNNEQAKQNRTISPGRPALPRG